MTDTLLRKAQAVRAGSSCGSFVGNPTDGSRVNYPGADGRRGPASREWTPMAIIATAALTADRIDPWIPQHIIQYCYGNHRSQSFGDRRVGMLAIGKCLRNQYDALPTPAPPHLAALVKRLETQN
jgi:hypothetical protein